MIEKVSPSHPDKIADRIAGAIVDLAYKKDDKSKCAVEVLIGHDNCNIIIESSVDFSEEEIKPIIERIAGKGISLNLIAVPQDKHLAYNQKKELRCGDNGIFRGIPLTEEEIELSKIAREIYQEFPYDGKYILDDKKLIICQSHMSGKQAEELYKKYCYYDIKINPLGAWTGGINSDTGAVNRKLGSDMASSITGGGIHGKDALSKCDVCANIWAFVQAQITGKVVELSCAIGDTILTGKIGKKKITIPFKEVSEFGQDYINKLGGYESLAEWGLF